MPQEINVTDTEFDYVEKILLPDGMRFDDERRAFIGDFSTLDLQSVPGSGKTTALLAKLLILERHMPLKNGRGVLMISHTNAAIDEIKERIGKYCPKLFSYPNFIGTIQSFVDTFLAIPFYTNLYQQKPYRIDNEIYDEQVERFFKNTNNRGLKNFLSRQRDGLSFLKNIRLTPDQKLITGLQGTPNKFKLNDPKTQTYKSLLKFKVSLLEKGFIHYDDAYTLANRHLNNIKDYPKILQSRFRFIFVDEMQDMDIHQVALIEKIFHPDSNTLSIIQRIGDENQAIYNGGVTHLDSIWVNRANTIYISGSHRLNPKVASVVQNLALSDNSIDGRNQNPDGSEIDIKPTLILYNDSTIEKVIYTFADKIKELQNSGKIPENHSNKFMAVAWRKQDEDPDKISLKDYWPTFSNIDSSKQIDFIVLKDYLLSWDKEKKTLESARKNILNALLKILRIENITDKESKNYTKRKLIKFFKSLEKDEYETLKLKLYKCSMLCAKGKNQESLNLLRQYIPCFLSVFKKTISSSTSFINGESQLDSAENEAENETLFYDLDNIKIEVGTVHSSKGQTHTATLYLETYFQKDGRGDNAKSYESERLADQLLGNRITSTANKRVKQSARMAYVGFSRPTHLLCIAVHKNRFDRYLSGISRGNWDIIEIEEA